jgi:ketosteroid isomerase-like protein
MRSILFALLLLAGCATAPPAINADAIVAAERAFAADAAVRGWAAAFRSHAEASATVLSPDPINAHESLARIEGGGETTLDWRPAYAGIARSDDFGFTTGPFMIRGQDGVIGHYFTVWRRQPDGGWKWLFDAGTGVVDADPVPADFAVEQAPVAASAAASPEAAIAEVAALEEGDTAALAERLAADAHVNRPRKPRAIGREAARAVFLEDAGVRYASVRRDASAAGDMVFSLGEMRDAHLGAERLRFYARIWRRGPEGFEILFDEIVPRRAPR